MVLDNRTTSEKLAIAGMALSIVAAFLPWLSLGSLSVSGIEGGRDGVITLALAIVAAAVLFVHGWDRIDKVLVGLLGGIVATVGLLYIFDPALGVPETNPFRGAISPSIGVYLTALGGASMIAGSLYDRFSSDATQDAHGAQRT